jgi:hypothetical protein
MDNEYLHSIDASPYVEEGFLSHARATGAGLRQRLQNISPSEDPYQTPFYAQLMSYYKSFIKDVKNVLSEFAVGETSPLERLKKMQLTVEEKTILDSLENIYSQLVPIPSSTINEINIVSELIPSHISISQVMHNSLNEAWVGRKMAQISGNASNIINKYVQDLKGIYSKFLKNISRLFPNSPKETLSKEFKKNVGDPKITNNVSNVEGILKLVPNAVTEPEPTAAPSPTSQVNTKTPSVAPVAPQTAPNTQKDSLAEIVERVVEIIIDAVSSDERSEPWMNKPLPTDWNSPPVTKDNPTDQSSDVTSIEEKEDINKSDDNTSPTGEEEQEYKGEFLYNFHSKVNKYPGGSFNIEVKPTKTSLQTIKLSNGMTKELVVIWAVKDKSENNIFVKHKAVEKTQSNNTFSPSKPTNLTPGDYSIEEAMDNQWEVTHLFSFFDHQANPRIEGNKFDVETLIAQAHPSKGNVLAGANPKLLEKINSLNELFLRSCYAATSRKHMEFSRKGLNIRMADTGRVFHIKRDGHHEEVSNDAISLHVKSKNINERKKWIEALERIGWFKKNGIDVPKWQDEPSNAPLIPVPGGAADQAKLASATEVKDIPAAADAVKMLITMGEKPKAAIDLLQKVVDAHGGKLSTQEYVKLAKSPPKNDAISSEPSKVSKPAGEPPIDATVSTPVSKPAGGAPPSKDVTAPVSSPNGKVETPGGDTPKHVDTPKPENGNIKFTEDGKVVWTKPDGKIVKFTPSQINSIHSPRLMAALKKVNYPFEKFKVNIKENQEELINPFRKENFLYN